MNKKVEMIDELLDRAKQLRHRDYNELDALNRKTKLVIRKVFGV